MKKILLIMLILGMLFMPRIKHQISNPFRVTVERLL